MPTGTMRRIRTVVTGVAGSPYYIVGYFTADTGTAQDCVDAWGQFCIANALDAKAGSTWRTEGDVELVSPITGLIVGMESATPRTIVGVASYNSLPPSAQVLVRWRTGNFVAGREVRGRTNLPLQSQASADSTGRVSDEVISAYNSRAFAVVSDPATVHVVWSKKNGVWWATETVSTWDQFSVLRSRRD